MSAPFNLPSAFNPEQFYQPLLVWFWQHGRHDLPWQVTNNPYAVWVSEIMLQQTQVKTVLDFYPRFMQRFPTVEQLAQATWQDTAPYWAGLGYYARARNLHKAAQQVVVQGGFPQDLTGWMALAGIGRSTAGAILSLGQQQFGVILDGNVKRVLARYFAIAVDLRPVAIERQLWQLAEYLTPADEHTAYTQAMMDLGATICTPKKPLCLYCPLQTHCQAYAQGRVLDLPIKKTKTATPQKYAHVLIIEHQDQWLWQRRPAAGLWGGLLSLPIIEDEADFLALCHDFGLNSQARYQLKHQFTHFTWHLTTHYYKVEGDTFLALQQRWTAKAEQSAQPPLAIPRAMQKIYTAFQKGDFTHNAAPLNT